METERMLDLARELIREVTFCVAITTWENGDSNARIVQPRSPGEDWTVDVMTNTRCRKV